MQLIVTAVRQLAHDIRAIELCAADGRALPAAAAGAHIRVAIPGRETTRAYSLISDPSDSRRYEIAVLRTPESAGGSAFLHQLQVGDPLEVSDPFDGFPLDPTASTSILIAGGIGITPILSLARELARGDRRYEVHYIARSWERLVFREELAALSGCRAKLYTAKSDFDLNQVLATPDRGTHVYVCGPYGLIETVREQAARAGIPQSAIHFESFGYRRKSSDRVVELTLQTSGVSVRAQPGQTLLEAIESAGVWLPSDCLRGECGTCVATLVEGTGDHRDHCLSAAERNHSICTCVSWARSDRLVLDI